MTFYTNWRGSALGGGGAEPRETPPAEKEDNEKMRDCDENAARNERKP